MVRFLSMGVAASTLVCFSFIGFAPRTHADMFTPLTSNLSTGMSGAQVTALQTFLASNPTYIYPAQLVTGYYGAMTAAAVAQFQLHYNINSIGIVGPVTLARMNSVIYSGLGLDVTAPSIISTSVQSVSTTSATVVVGTDSLAVSKVVYSTFPMATSEATMNFTAPYIQGMTAQASNTFVTSQAIVLPNLQSNTTYYYIVVSNDQSGNTNVTIQNTFHTN